MKGLTLTETIQGFEKEKTRLIHFYHLQDRCNLLSPIEGG